MSGGLVALIIVLGIIAIVVISAISAFNGVVGLNEDVNNKKSQIDNQLQRRADLIPNFVETVKGYMAHETAAIKAVTDARAKLAGASTTEAGLQANNELTGALSRLLVVVENYPDLKANTQFTALQDELAGTENRIATARKDYNDAVTSYNRKIRTFPTNIFAGMFGFDKAAYFEASGNATNVPDLSGQFTTSK